MDNKKNHIIRTQDFNRSWLETKFFPEAAWMEKILREKNGPFLLRNVLTGKNVLLVFWEPSTRTRNRFHIAAQKLGAGIIVVQGTKIGDKWKLIYSSEMKGEIFEDTIRTFASQGADCIVMRHPIEGFVSKAAMVIDEFGYNTPIINAGDGPGQHPTQALIDLYSIKKDFGQIDGLSCVLLGDLLGSRAIHSLAYLLGKFKVKFYLVSPAPLKMPQNIIEHFNNHSIPYEIIKMEDFQKFSKKVDFVYAVRTQDERYKNNKDIMDYLASYKPIVLDKNLTLKCLKKNGRIYHPFPINEEIVPWRVNDIEAGTKTIDKMPQAGYFDQISNGIPVSMALLKMILNPDANINDLWNSHFTDSVLAQCVVCGRVKSKLMGWGENAINPIATLPKIFCPDCAGKTQK